jgi:hypothetical protein
MSRRDESFETAVGRDPDRGRALAQDETGLACGEAHHGAQHDRLGLLARQRPDQGDGRSCGHRLHRRSLGVVGSTRIRGVGHRYRRSSRATAKVVHRPVADDARRPAAEVVDTATEPAQVARDVQPGVGRHVVRVLTHETHRVAVQPRLQMDVQLRERGVVALDRALQDTS